MKKEKSEEAGQTDRKEAILGALTESDIIHVRYIR